MTNVSKGMEYATTFEREAMREKLDAALGGRMKWSEQTIPERVVTMREKE